ncbi:phosphotransferase [Calidifontibacter sp. DB0510]|uniref:Phosphotransferase n=1 Tax=Metallococcus carri TaxID=1656884 RepID=A0A967AWZ5_9MICO|nr:aminoglycoside phosphotransferase family protein [Metallococcus carri]NHN54524.1 phosphotransferase [Metallococcus carri]NOP36637.1 phosphotransferase [Calidifontibacter sp. DB2511S]
MPIAEEISEATLARARSQGDAGEAWLRQLPLRYAELCARWQLTPGPAVVGGSASFVRRVTRRDGSAAVLRISLPDPSFAQRLATLRAADGHGYVRVLEADTDALLLESLGESLAVTTTDIDRVVRVASSLLTEAWLAPEATGLGIPEQDGAVVGLLALIETELGRITVPVPVDLVEHAKALLAERQRAWDPTKSVVVHGDPHADNILAAPPRPGAVGGYVLIDPDGFVADPAYDLGVLLRGWSDHLVAADDPAAEIDRWCAIAAEHTGVDPEAIQQWAFIERVTTGLHLLGLGLHDLGRSFLAPAAAVRP